MLVSIVTGGVLPGFAGAAAEAGLLGAVGVPPLRAPACPPNGEDGTSGIGTFPTSAPSPAARNVAIARLRPLTPSGALGFFARAANSACACLIAPAW